MFSHTPQITIQPRWKALQRAMQTQGAEALLVSTNVNLFYLSGRVYSGYCYLPAEGEPLFFVRRPVGLTGVIYIRKVEDIPAYFAAQGQAFPTTLLLENDSIPHSEYLRYEKTFAGVNLQNGTPLIRGVRAVKTPYEIDLLRLSARLHTEAYAQIPSLYREGMTDFTFSIEIERAMRLRGCLGLFRVFGQSMEIFMGSVLAGPNADQPSPYDFAMGGAGLNDALPGGCNGTRIEPGMSVMVDLGGNFTGYMSDMSRVFARGELPELAHRAHACSLEIVRRVEAAARAGVEAKALYELSCEIAAQAGLSEYFMGHRQQAGFVGHGVGIEINEAPVLAPRSRDVLEVGMVFALEPKFVIPQVGPVGIENTYVVVEHGIEKLTLAPEAMLPLGH